MCSDIQIDEKFQNESLVSLDERFNVNIELYFVKLIDVVEELEKFNTLSEIKMTWIDPRLAWDPAKFGGIKEMRVNVETVWQPENALSDTSQVYEIYADEVKPVILNANGSVSILRKYYAESTCKMTNAEDTEKLGVLLEIIYVWEDRRLIWDPSMFNGINKIYANYKNLWIVENSMSETAMIVDFVADHRKPVKVFANGTVSFLHKFYAEIICKLELGHFPFDSQDCPIILTAMSYDYDEVTMTVDVTPIELKYASSGQWDVQKIDGSVDYYNYSSTSFEQSTFHIYMKRQPLFYIHVIVVPSLIITVLSVGGIFWTSGQEYHNSKLDKLGIGLTSLMSMTVLLGIVASEIPKTNSFPILGTYMVVSLFDIGLACVVLMLMPASKEITDKKEKIRFRDKIRAFIFNRTFALHLLFQTVNFLNFGVFMSFWK